MLAVLVGAITLFFLPRYPDDLQKRKAQGKKHWIFTDAQIDLAAERFASEPLLPLISAWNPC